FQPVLGSGEGAPFSASRNDARAETYSLSATGNRLDLPRNPQKRELHVIRRSGLTVRPDAASGGRRATDTRDAGGGRRRGRLQYDNQRQRRRRDRAVRAKRRRDPWARHRCQSRQRPRRLGARPGGTGKLTRSSRGLHQRRERARMERSGRAQQPDDHQAFRTGTGRRRGVFVARGIGLRIMNARSKMKAAIFVEPGRIVLEDKPVPDVGPTDALMRITTTTICGTDIHILKGEYPVVKGLTIGHEPVGVIEKLGSAITGYVEGQRVIA